MKYSLLLAATILCINVSAQLQWVKSVGGQGADYATANAVDGAGNVYSTGVFENTVDFDPGAGTFNLTSAGNADIFVSKLDAAGNFVWSVQMGGTNIEVPRDITADATGNIYITGYFTGTADFDPGAGTLNFTATSESIYVVKLTNSGTLIWAKHMAQTTPYNSSGSSIAADATGNVYVGGHFEGTVDFDPGAGTSVKTSIGFYDAFIAKLDASGNFVWANSFDGPNGESISGIRVDANSNVYACGALYGTTDFDPDTAVTNSLTSNGFWDMFILKITSSGTFLWVKQIGSTDYDYAQAIALDAGNNIYVSGYYVGTVDFDPGAGTSNLTGPVGAGQTFALKLDVNGNFLWAQTVISTISGSEGKSIAVDAAGNVYIAGIYITAADANPGPAVTNLPVNGSDDSFLSKFDSQGNFGWAVHYGSSSNDWIWDVATGPTGDIYTAGFFLGNGELDPSEQVASFPSNGQHDVMLHRFANCPANNTVYLNGITLTAEASVASYQWYDCNTWQPVIGATDQSFTPAIAGTYAAIISGGTCIDTTVCTFSAGLGMEENELVSFSVYPNPTNGIITVQLNQVSTDAQIEIFNATGQLVATAPPLGNTITVELPEENGIYLVRITMNDASSTRTVIKE